jgi:hypothetical protein
VAYIRVTGCSPLKRMGNAADATCSGSTLFRIFHGFGPPSMVLAPHPRLVPKVLVHLGELRGLIYRSDKGNCGQHKTYIHFMDKPARLTCDPTGRQLYIVGGDYRITKRGIEG